MEGIGAGRDKLGYLRDKLATTTRNGVNFAGICGEIAQIVSEMEDDEAEVVLNYARKHFEDWPLRFQSINPNSSEIERSFAKTAYLALGDDADVTRSSLSQLKEDFPNLAHLSLGVSDSCDGAHLINEFFGEIDLSLFYENGGEKSLKKICEEFQVPDQVTTLNVVGAKPKDMKHLGAFRNLSSIGLSHCKLKNLKVLAGLSQLRSISLDYLNNLKSLEGVDEVESLRISYCEKLSSLESLSEAKIDSIELLSCPKLTNLIGLPSGVKRVGIQSCFDLRGIDGVPPSVEELKISSCNDLEGLDGIEALEGLKVFHLNWSSVMTVEELMKVPTDELEVLELREQDRNAALELARSAQHLSELSLDSSSNTLVDHEIGALNDQVTNVLD